LGVDASSIMADLGGCVTLWGGVIAIAKPEIVLRSNHGEPSPPAPSLEPSSVRCTTLQAAVDQFSTDRIVGLDHNGVEIEVVGVDIMAGYRRSSA